MNWASMAFRQSSRPLIRASSKSEARYVRRRGEAQGPQVRILPLRPEIIGVFLISVTGQADRWPVATKPPHCIGRAAAMRVATLPLQRERAIVSDCRWQAIVRLKER